MANQNAVLAVQNANSAWGRQLVDGDPQGGHLPLDQMVAIFTQNGGQGGLQGMVNDMNEVGKPTHMTAQDFGVPWDTLMPGLAAYYKANPNQMPDVTPNTQNLADIVTNNTASKFLDANGNFTADKATWDAAQEAEIKKYGIGAGDRSFGALAKSFATEGALPFIAKAALAGGGLESFLSSGAGALAGDAFMPGALGADGLGSVGAAGSGLAGDAYLPAGLGSDGAGLPGVGNASWGVNPRADSSVGDAYLPGTLASGAGDAYMPGALGGSSAGNALASGVGAVAGDSYLPGALGSALSPAEAAAGVTGASYGSTSILDRLKSLLNPSSGTGGQSLIPGVSNQILGSLLSGGFGIAGSDAARSANNALADKYLAYGAPSRARYEASMTPGFDATSIPGYKSAIDYGTKASMNALSTQGNPIGSPNAWNQTLSDVTAKIGLPAIQNYQAQNANAGGISSFTPASIGATNAASTATTNMFNSAGSAINDIFNPRPSLAQTLSQYKSLLAA